MVREIRRKNLTSRKCFWFTRLAASVAIVVVASGPVAAEALSPQQQLAFDIYKELVEINTVTATGDTAQAAVAMAARLKAAGFADADVHAFSPAPRKGNLVARLHGTGARKPILLMAHLDVVPASREDWTTDPFKLTNTWRPPLSPTSFATSRKATSPIAISSWRSRPTRKFSTAMAWGFNGCSRTIAT
jgi:hypothetical protein